MVVVALFTMTPSELKHTWPPVRFFIPMSPFPFLPFLFFFFLQQHFLMMQKQHVRMSKAATTAMAIMAHDGNGILSISFRNLFLISSKASFLLLTGSVELSAATSATGAGVTVKSLAPVDFAATMGVVWCLNKFHFVI